MKKLGKAEKRAGFGDAMSNGGHDNPPLCDLRGPRKAEGNIPRRERTSVAIDAR